MARIEVKDLPVDESLDAKALSWIWGGKGSAATRSLGLLAQSRELSALIDRALGKPAPRP